MWASFSTPSHFPCKFEPKLHNESEAATMSSISPCHFFPVKADNDQSYHIGYVNLKRWHAVASWTWDAQDETCGICRMAFDGCCPDCKLPGDDCPLIWGACNHAFHLHCILKWVNSQTSQAHCPMCRREWQFKE
uniref:Anaphase-promoting complex subunit 11 n=2 Tax=Salix viminalis TaxID=40686 RepID=A0A6N2N6P6_SALVM